MRALRTLAALSVVAFAPACTATGHVHPPSPSASAAPVPVAAAGTPASSDPRMKAMQEMHQKMRAATTPAERQALMAEHLKALQGGMAMMKEMHAKHAGGGMGMIASPAARRLGADGRHGRDGRGQRQGHVARHGQAPRHDGGAHGLDAVDAGHDGRPLAHAPGSAMRPSRPAPRTGTCLRGAHGAPHWTDEAQGCGLRRRTPHPLLGQPPPLPISAGNTNAKAAPMASSSNEHP